MLAPEHPAWEKADEINEVEHKCDFLTHEIIQRLNRTFVTPHRPRRHSRARAVARRRDGCHRRLRDSRAAISPRHRALRRARARPHHHRVHRPGAAGARRARAEQGAHHPRDRDQPPRERSGPRAPAGRQPPLRRRARSDRRDEVEGDARLPRGGDGSLRRRRERARGRHGQNG